MFSMTRHQLATHWLTIPTEQLAEVYAGDLGNAHRSLLNNGIQYEPMETETEHQFTQQLLAYVATGFEQPLAIQYLLAAMLYYRADQLPLQYQKATVPGWFLADYLKFMFTPPRLFQQVGESLHYCKYLQNWVNFLHAVIFSQPEAEFQRQIATFFAQSASFLPLYFNTENLCEVFTKRGDILELVLNKQGFPLEYSFPPQSSASPKIRVGILTRHFTPHTETFATIPLFEYLDRDQFEVILYTLQVTQDPLEQYCLSRVDKWIHLPPQLIDQVQTIRADDLDVLFIGTNIAAVTHPITVLAAYRLGRLQATCFNSPVTTGLRNMDYYLTGKLCEPSAQGQSHYRERLITMEGTGFCFSYTVESYTKTIEIDRASLNISESATVFISATNFFKLIPELREIWVKILVKVPNSVLILLPFGPTWSDSYPVDLFIKNMQALLARHGVDGTRLHIFKPLPNRADVKEVLKLGDVYLDSYPYASTTSLIDALEVGLPTVVREGKTLRSRMGAAVLKSISLVDLVTDDEKSYIRLAVGLGNQPQLRAKKKQQILEKMRMNPPFLDSRNYAAKIGKLLQKLVKESPKK